MRSETFKMGQKVVFRKDWFDSNYGSVDTELSSWNKMEYMTVVRLAPDGWVALNSPVKGSWNDLAITAYIKPITPQNLPEELFEL